MCATKESIHLEVNTTMHQQHYTIVGPP